MLSIHVPGIICFPWVSFFVAKNTFKFIFFFKNCFWILANFWWFNRTSNHKRGWGHFLMILTLWIWTSTRCLPSVAILVSVYWDILYRLIYFIKASLSCIVIKWFKLSFIRLTCISHNLFLTFKYRCLVFGLFFNILWLSWICFWRFKCSIICFI